MLDCLFCDHTERLEVEVSWRWLNILYMHGKLKVFIFEIPFFSWNCLWLFKLMYWGFRLNHKNWYFSNNISSSYGVKCSWPMKLQDSLICNISRKKWMKCICGIQITIEVFYKLKLSFWVSVSMPKEPLK